MSRYGLQNWPPCIVKHFGIFAEILLGTDGIFFPVSKAPRVVSCEFRHIFGTALFFLLLLPPCPFPAFCGWVPRGGDPRKGASSSIYFGQTFNSYHWTNKKTNKQKSLFGLLCGQDLVFLPLAKRRDDSWGGRAGGRHMSPACTEATLLGARCQCVCVV